MKSATRSLGPAELARCPMACMPAQPTNMAAVGSASELIFRDAKLSLMGAGVRCDAGRRRAAKHMFGDDPGCCRRRPAAAPDPPSARASYPSATAGRRRTIQATIPRAADPAVVSKGFANLTPLVRQSLRAFMIGGGLHRGGRRGQHAAAHVCG